MTRTMSEGVPMLIKKAEDIPSSEITPQSLYLNRRKFLAGCGHGGRSDSGWRGIGATLSSPSAVVLARHED